MKNSHTRESYQQSRSQSKLPNPKPGPAMKPSENRFALLDDGVGVFEGKKGEKEKIACMFYQPDDIREYKDFPALHRERKYCQTAVSLPATTTHFPTIS